MCVAVVSQVISDTELLLACDDPSVLAAVPCGTPVKYDVFLFVDQSEMFAKVHSALAAGQCLGIFPEG